MDHSEEAADASVYLTLFSKYVSVGKVKTSFDEKVMAKSVALQELLLILRDFKMSVILVDSQVTIHQTSIPLHKK